MKVAWSIWNRVAIPYLVLPWLELMKSGYLIQSGIRKPCFPSICNSWSNQSLLAWESQWRIWSSAILYYPSYASSNLELLKEVDFVEYHTVHSKYHLAWRVALLWEISKYSQISMFLLKVGWKSINSNFFLLSLPIVIAL